MRRILIFFMALVMACSVCLGEAADVEVETDAAEEDERLASFESWQTRIGNVTIALPGIPTACNPEGDWEGYWKNSLYVWGNCVHDHMDYQLRTADIGPWIESLGELYPDEDPAQLRINALINFTTMQLDHMDGQVEGKVGLDPEREMMLFAFTYPDTPDVTYSAKAFLDGTQATALYMGECNHLEEAQKRFRKLKEEELASRTEDDPYWLHFMGLPLTFPRKPYILEVEGRYTLNCLADDFTRIIAFYDNIGLSIPTDESAEDGTGMEPFMKDLAQPVINNLGGGTILEGTVTQYESDWVYEYTFLLDNSLNEAYPDLFRWRGVYIVSPNGLWTLLCNDTETGRAFMDSMGETTDATISPRYRLVNSTLEAQHRQKDASPATLGQFIQDLAALLRANEDGEMFDEEYVTVGDAMLCDGRWVRTVMCQATDIMALLFVSSDEEDAVVNEIHVVVGEDYNEVVFDILASCCIEAAEGKTDTAVKLLRNEEKRKDGASFQWKGERYEAVKSFVDNSMPYYLMTITALNPAELEHIPEEKENPDVFAEPMGTVKQFRDRWYRLNQNIYSGQFRLSHLDPQDAGDGKVAWISVFGDSTSVGLTTASEGENAGIISARVFNMHGDVQQTFLGGLMALAALTHMPDEQFYLMTMMIMEHPLWDDLLELNPVAGWNGKQLVLVEGEYDGEFVPTAYILDQ